MRAASSGQGSLLDIGCSLGYTLQAARMLGPRAVGVDTSAVAVEHCRSLGFECAVGSLDRLPFEDGRFSVITMKHVLEHTMDPRSALREVRRVLRPGGALFIAVPNADYGKARRAPLRSRFYRPDAHGGVEHWVYYTPDTLSRFLLEESFSVRKVHPKLLHGGLTIPPRIAEMLLLPLRALQEYLLTTLRVRKEFWLVCQKVDEQRLARGSCLP